MDWNRLLSRAPAWGFPPTFDSPAPITAISTVWSSPRPFAAARQNQVFPLSQSDPSRTRLTHIWKLSSVGRSLGTIVGDSVIRRHQLQGVYPQVSARWSPPPGLAHDIGNPPFGHAAEDIRLWFTASTTGRTVLEQLDDATAGFYLRFEGNVRGLSSS